MKLCRKLVALCSMVVFASVAYADTVMLNYQGRLKQKDGPLVNGNVQMEFRMYDDADGGVCLYQETNLVMVVDGVYSVVLGKNPIMGDLGYAMQSSNAYLEVIINGNPLRPREKYVRPGSAHKATSADTATVAETSTVAQVAVFAEKATDHWRMFALARDGTNSFIKAQNMAGQFQAEFEPNNSLYGYSWGINNSDRTVILFPPVWEHTEVQNIRFFKAHETVQEDPTCNLQPFVWGEIRDYTGALVRTITASNTLMRGLPVGQWLDLPLVTNVVLQAGQVLTLQGYEERARDNLPTEGAYGSSLYLDVQVK